MRNGNIALGLALMVIGLLAAEGILKPLWSAIANGAPAGSAPKLTGGGPNSNLTTGGIDPVTLQPTGKGPNIDPVTLQPITNTVSDPVKTNPLGALGGKFGPNNSVIYPLPVAGQDTAFNTVYAKWPAGYDSQWKAFTDCYHQYGSIETCRPFILSTDAKG